MFVRHDHDVAADVRVDVQDDKIEPGAFEDEFFLIVCRVVQDVAKNAAARYFRSRFTAAFNVIVSPRTPEYIHRSSFLLTFVNELLQFLSGLKISNAFSRNVDRLTRFRVAAFS